MPRVSFFLFLAFLLSACAAPPAAEPKPDSTPTGKKSTLPDLGPAPELTNETWLNVAAPLRLADLRGKVVLLDMWTFG